jgi:uncharacterized RDD family membrane protein YckC
MQNIQIETTQNVHIEYETASVGERILASLLDYLIIFGYFFGVMILFSSLTIEYTWGVITLIMLPVFFYDLVSEIVFNGQSIGKKTLKIKVVKIDGLRPALGDYLLRWVMRPIDISLLFGAVAIITILINGKGQRLGDIAANTSVIRLKSRVTIADTILKDIEDDYQPVYPLAATLKDSDIAVIKEVMTLNVSQIDINAYEKIIKKVHKKFAYKLDAPMDMNPYQFLNTVIKDFNYYNRY